MEKILLLNNYDWNKYLEKYSDFTKNKIDNEIKALEHYIKLGKQEKREIFHKKSSQFVNEEIDEDLFNNYNWQEYIKNNIDLKNNNLKSDFDGYNHYKKYGKNENRVIFPNLIEYIDHNLYNAYLENISKMNIHIDDSNINNINKIVPNLKLQSIPYSDSKYIISSKLPWGYYSTSGIQKIINSYNDTKKYIIVFLISDCSDILNIPQNMIIFRTSLYKSQRQKNEYVLPYVWEKINKSFHILKKTKNPIIGFYGQVDDYNKKFIDILENNNNINCNFIINEDFLDEIQNDPNLIEELSNNIITSHFVICNRGRGNFSKMFYQTLSAGRIPIIVDTDMIFPFEDEIDWNSFIVCEKDEEEVIKKLLYWWNNKNIEEIQKKCKYIYDNFIDQKIYFNKILNDIYINKIKF